MTVQWTLETNIAGCAPVTISTGNAERERDAWDMILAGVISWVKKTIEEGYEKYEQIMKACAGTNELAIIEKYEKKAAEEIGGLFYDWWKESNMKAIWQDGNEKTVLVEAQRFFEYPHMYEEYQGDPANPHPQTVKYALSDSTSLIGHVKTI